MTNKHIHRFQEEFIVKDSGVFARKYNDFVKLITDDFRDRGYIPILDIDPYIETEYNEGKDNFKYTITVHGVHVGIQKARLVEGLVGGKEIKRIPQIKSKQSSKQLV